jgi:hypothetical protein
MKSHEIIRRMPSALAGEIFTFLQTERKPIYKAVLQGLANQRNLRVLFIERKPPNERHAWLQSALGRSLSNVLAGHVLQAWLLGANKEMLCDFLDAMGVKHEQDGTVDEIPPSPAREKVVSAVQQLLSRYPAEKVAVYLHAFREMDSAAQWPPLDEMLAEESRLALGA